MIDGSGIRPYPLDYRNRGIGVEVQYHFFLAGKQQDDRAIA
jgi:hypothetical protein